MTKKYFFFFYFFFIFFNSKPTNQQNMKSKTCSVKIYDQLWRPIGKALVMKIPKEVPSISTSEVALGKDSVTWGRFLSNIPRYRDTSFYRVEFPAPETIAGESHDFVYTKSLSEDDNLLSQCYFPVGKNIVLTTKSDENNETEVSKEKMREEFEVRFIIQRSHYIH